MLMLKVKKSDFFFIPVVFIPRLTAMCIARAQIQCSLDLNNCVVFEKHNNQK